MSYSLFCLIILGVATGLSYGAEPNWIGTFTIDPNCDQTVCCCLSGEVKIKDMFSFFMTISGKLEGQCKGLPMLFLPVRKPTGFSTKLPIIGVVNLSDDSSRLTAESPIGPQCNGVAIRS